MAEITREYIEGKRAAIRQQIAMFEGALEMLTIIETDLLKDAALSMDQLKDVLGAQSVGEPEPIE